jgi:hypothetical protein
MTKYLPSTMSSGNATIDMKHQHKRTRDERTQKTVLEGSSRPSAENEHKKPRNAFHIIMKSTKRSDAFSLWRSNEAPDWDILRAKFGATNVQGIYTLETISMTMVAKGCLKMNLRRTTLATRSPMMTGMMTRSAVLYTTLMVQTMAAAIDFSICGPSTFGTLMETKLVDFEVIDDCFHENNVAIRGHE